MSKNNVIDIIFKKLEKIEEFDPKLLQEFKSEFVDYTLYNFLKELAVNKFQIEANDIIAEEIVHMI